MNEFHTFIGIDPGKQGSMTVLTPSKTILFPTPCNPDYDIWKMNMMLKDYASSHTFAVLERAQAMPGQGVVSMFEFGKGYGIWLALLNVNYISFQVVHSRVWTNVMLAGAPGEGKERNLLAARKLFPKWVFKLKKEEQYADSLLLAVYAKRIQIGGVENDRRTEGNNIRS
jgi:crossover junction endodeoxyribonuclease RuvC